MGEKVKIRDRPDRPIVVYRRDVRQEDWTQRWHFAAGIDWLLHLLIAVGVGYFLPFGHESGLAVVVAIGAFVGASFIDRVLLQWAIRATVGKALIALVLVRADTRGRLSFRLLSRTWLLSVARVTGATAIGMVFGVALGEY
jgi:hypothetical protein